MSSWWNEFHISDKCEGAIGTSIVCPFVIHKKYNQINSSLANQNEYFDYYGMTSLILCPL